MPFACIFVPDFSVEAVVRAQPELREQPVAVLAGKPPLVKVFAANEKARDLGIEPAMTKLQAEVCPGVVLRPRSLLDRAAMIGALVGISAHPVWIGLMLSWGLGFRLHWFPITGYCDFINPSGAENCGGPTQWAYHLVLPWLTFAALYAALYVRMVRASVVETLAADWVTTARAKGGSFLHVFRAHVLRNAMLPVVTMLGMDIAVALGGSLFVENVWGLPGLGNTALSSLTLHDLPTTEGITVFVAVCVIVLNLVVDTSYAFIDPRVRLHEAH